MRIIPKTVHFMRKIVLFDTEESVGNLLPLSFTRPVSHLRVGVTTIAEKWQRMMPGLYQLLVSEFLNDSFVFKLKRNDDALFVASNILPSAPLVKEIEGLEKGEALFSGGGMIAFHGNLDQFEGGGFDKRREYSEPVSEIKYVFDIFLKNHEALVEDYFALTRGRESRPLSETNTLIGDVLDSDGRQMIFLEPGAKVEGAILNVKDGPIYIGVDAEIMEGSCVRGPLALCNNAKVKMGAKIYGATTLGPYCKAGGELNNVVMTGYSNKAHEGFLGNAGIGEWCNIGAGVNASNLKNDYSKIRIWNYRLHTFMRTDLQFCGLIMGDHSKAGVNCMFNTATVLGVGVNVHGAGFPRVFIPSFSEGSAAGGFSDVSLKKFFDIASRVMNRRGLDIDESQKKVFEHVYAISQSHK